MLTEAVCISFHVYSFEKKDRLGYLALVRQLVKEKEKQLNSRQKLTLCHDLLMGNRWVNTHAHTQTCDCFDYDIYICIYIYIHIYR